MIVLVGAPASGKTSVGAALAGRRGVGFVDVDDEISARLGPVGDAFVELGEAAFRAVEREACLATLATSGDTVVALSSGGVADPEVVTALAGHDVVWLAVDAPTVLQRLGLQAHAPVGALQLRSTLVRQLKERDEQLAAVARHRVDTVGRELDDVVADVAALFAAG